MEPDAFRPSSDTDEDEWWELDAAAEEVKALRASAQPSIPTETPDPWRRDRAPATPPPAGASPLPPCFTTASQLQARRWSRLCESPSELSSLPLDVYPTLFLHAPLHAQARLALCSKAWAAVAAELVVTPAFFDSLAAHEAEHSGLSLPDYRRGAKHLLGALACLTAGPADAVVLIERMHGAAASAEQPEIWLDLFAEPRALAEAAFTCPRRNEWTLDLLLRLFRLSQPCTPRWRDRTPNPEALTITHKASSPRIRTVCARLIPAHIRGKW